MSDFNNLYNEVLFLNQEIKNNNKNVDYFLLYLYTKKILEKLLEIKNQKLDVNNLIYQRKNIKKVIAIYKENTENFKHFKLPSINELINQVKEKFYLNYARY